MSRRRLWTSFAVLLAIGFWFSYDTFQASVLLPTVVADLGAGIQASSLLIATYFIVVSGLLATLGRAGDRIGQRKTLAAALIAAVVASTMLGFATNLGMLFAARVLAGIAAAAAIPATVGSISRMFTEGRARAAGFAGWVVSGSVAATMGALVGSAVASRSTWRLGPWVEAAIALVLVLAVVVAVEPSAQRDKSRPDFVGSLLWVLFIVALVTGLQAIDRRGDAAMIALLAAAVVLLGGLAIWELRRIRFGHTALFDPDVMRIRSFRDGLLVWAVGAFVKAGVFVTIPIYSHFILMHSPTAAGQTIALMTLGAAVGAVIGARAADRFGRRRTVIGGLAAEAVILIGSLPLVLPAGDDWRFAFAVGALGVASGAVTASLLNLVLVDVRAVHAGLASGIVKTVGGLAGALSIVLTTLVFTAFAGTELNSELRGLPDLSVDERREISDVAELHSIGDHGRKPILELLTRASDSTPLLRPEIVDSFGTAFAKSGRLLAGIGAAVAALGAVFALRLPRRTEANAPD